MLKAIADCCERETSAVSLLDQRHCSILIVVGVAQKVERRISNLAVVGSRPTAHPT